MPDSPLCFVLMPFGRKKDPTGGPDVDFDAIFDTAIRPGIEDAGMEPIRADTERTGGIIHKAMFERLLLCDFAVADMTTGNANVFYEIGVRHAARPATTLPIFADSQKPLFDVNYLRALPYQLAEGNKFGAAEAAKLRASLSKRLGELRDIAARDGAPDSPVFQLIEGYGKPDLAHLKTDVFRDRARYSSKVKGALAAARTRRDAGAVSVVEKELGALDGVEVGVLVDLLLSYRAVEGLKQMTELFERLPVVLQRSVLVREQLAFARNRLGDREEAIRLLEEVLAERGPNPETCGLLGRVYKDLWNEAVRAADEDLAAGYLDRSIATYSRGFESDFRDAYPGINAVTLLDIRGDAESLRRKDEMLPVVRFAVTQRLKTAQPNYWDHATLLELDVLGDDEARAATHLAAALASVREKWEPKTTANNLTLIRDARAKRGAAVPWVDRIIEALSKRGA